jgi:hypothetical protein
MFYAISRDGSTVLSYKRIANATDKATELNGYVGSDATETDTGLTNVPSPVLVALHNAIRPEKPVTRFSDKATGEKRLKGVLEVLSKPGDIVEVPEVVVEEVEEEYIPDPALSAEENEQMAAAKKGAKKGAKKSAAKKTGAKKAGVPKKVISDAVVARVIKMRADGKGWPEILAALGETSNSFIHRIRPLMKAVDKSSVKKMGPGSPNYGKAKKAK